MALSFRIESLRGFIQHVYPVTADQWWREAAEHFRGVLRPHTNIYCIFVDHKLHLNPLNWSKIDSASSAYILVLFTDLEEFLVEHGAQKSLTTF